MHVLQVCDKELFFFFQSTRLEKHVHVSKTYCIRKVGGGRGVSAGQKKKKIDPRSIISIPHPLGRDRPQVITPDWRS